jgi:hypothetical protein
MTRDDIIDLANQAGLRIASVSDPIDPRNVYWHEIERFAALVAAAERQQIAAEFEKRHEGIKHLNNYWLHAANYVKERGNT